MDRSMEVKKVVRVRAGAVARLPKEIVSEIVLRTQFKSILRCKLVSKELRETIGESKFFNQYKPKRRRALFLVWNRLFCIVIDQGKHNNENEGETAVKCKNPPLIVQEIPIGSKYSAEYDRVRWKHQLLNPGSSDGMACFKSFKGPLVCYNLFSGGAPFQVEDAPIPPDSWLCYGFGYDRVGDDYKVIVVAANKDDVHKSRPSTWIHSLRNKGWKPLLQGFPVDDDAYEWPDGSSRGCCFNGVLHWVAINKRSREVILFTYDLHTGRFGQLLGPARSSSAAAAAAGCTHTYLSAHLVELNGQLCLVTLNVFTKVTLNLQLCSACDTGPSFHVWLMNNNSSNHSWEKLASIDTRIQESGVPWKWVIPAVLYDCGDATTRALLFICHHDGRMFWYPLGHGDNQIQVIIPYTWHTSQKTRQLDFDF